MCLDNLYDFTCTHTFALFHLTLTVTEQLLHTTRTKSKEPNRVLSQPSIQSRSLSWPSFLYWRDSPFRMWPCRVFALHLILSLWYFIHAIDLYPGLLMPVLMSRRVPEWMSDNPLPLQQCDLDSLSGVLAAYSLNCVAMTSYPVFCRPPRSLYSVSSLYPAVPHPLWATVSPSIRLFSTYAQTSSYLVVPASISFRFLNHWIPHEIICSQFCMLPSDRQPQLL